MNQTQAENRLRELTGWQWLALGYDEICALVQDAGGEIRPSTSRFLHVRHPGTHTSRNITVLHDLYPDFACWSTTSYGEVSYKICDIPKIGWYTTYRTQDGIDEVLLDPPESSLTLATYLFSRAQWDQIPARLRPQVCDWLAAGMEPAQVAQALRATGL